MSGVARLTQGVALRHTSVGQTGCAQAVGVHEDGPWAGFQKPCGYLSSGRHPAIADRWAGICPAHLRLYEQQPFVPDEVMPIGARRWAKALPNYYAAALGSAASVGEGTDQ